MCYAMLSSQKNIRHWFDFDDDRVYTRQKYKNSFDLFEIRTTTNQKSLK